jgi:hypothetical protein
MRGGHAKINEIKERKALSVYRCICGLVNEKSHFQVGHKTKDTTQKQLFKRVLPYVCKSVIGQKKSQP